MFESITYVLLYLTPVIFNTETCGAELPPLAPAHPAPALSLHPPGDPEYTDVVVKREFDNLTLVCALRGDTAPRMYVWNYVGANTSTEHRPFTVEPAGPTLSSTLTKLNLQLGDSGHYMCSAPPFSVTKYILVQTRGPQQCARGAFWCGAYCVLATYVCDGVRDCARGEDEAPPLCAPAPCHGGDKLNCSSGRCISEAACCRAGAGGAACHQPACCDEHPRYSRLEGYVDVEYPPLFEDRRAPDDYGFIQSTIYTVTACALIFMIAVVLLVSAICKMHMKRAALRSYAHAERATAHHYNMHYAQAHRFPPCYEASRLLEAGAAAGSPPPSAPASPASRPLQCSTECPPEEAAGEGEGAEAGGGGEDRAGFGLARLSAIFSSRYRQVPTQCLDVEMTDVRSASLNSSPTRHRTRARLDDYRSPTYCDLNTDLFFNPETSNCGRDLNYMATPVEFFRRRTLRGNFDRVLEQMNRPRPLTLQLGRFQLSIPRLGRRTSLERRPDTPNVAELNIDDIDFVRLNSNETYTLNGRTIRLLGANFENYPGLTDTAVRPPPYTEAVRYKLYGPPPEYLSRDGLNSERDNVNNTNTVSTVTVNEEQARSNVEMPPCYEDLASGVDANANVENDVSGINNGTDNAVVSTECSNENNVTSNSLSDVTNVTSNGVIVMENISSVIDNLPAIDSDVNANGTETVFSEVNNGNNELANNNVC